MEKKLTDEEIVKAYEICVISEGFCPCCPYNIKNIDCTDRKVQKDTLDLIHRLQDENELLKQEKQLAYDTVKGYSLTDIEQKAEIERLTEELAEEKKLYFDMQDVAGSRYMENCQLIKQRNELQKQVDELNEIIKIREKEMFEVVKDCQRLTVEKEQAVKDTAKEILQELYETPHEWCENKILNIAKRYGVEVE